MKHSTLTAEQSDALNRLVADAGHVAVIHALAGTAYAAAGRHPGGNVSLTALGDALTGTLRFAAVLGPRER